MKKNPVPNYLENIPLPKAGVKYEIVDGEVTLFRENRGLFNFLAQKLLGKPRVSKIHLDTMGNFIWPLMDGNKDIMQIASLVKEEFGEKAEPLYARIAQYFKMLCEYGFVEFRDNLKGL